MKHIKLLLFLSFCGVLLPGACQKPDNSQSSQTPQITVPPASQTFFSSGINFTSGEIQLTPGGSTGGGTGSGGQQEEQQTQTVNFTAPSAWTASVEATKAVDWLKVEPSSGGAGDVTMKVMAQPNETYEDRAATVTIKSGDTSIFFTVKQAGKTRIEVTEVKLDQTDLTLNLGESTSLVATVLPENATDKTVIWSSSNAEVATVDENGKVTAVTTGEASITAKAGEKTANCKVLVIRTIPDAVDLGLSVLWAKCNLGATKPDEYGNYFAWGEIETRDVLSYFDFNNYKWGKRTDLFGTGVLDFEITKYNLHKAHGTVDNKTVLEPEDDAAHVILGKKWRMPTVEEMHELREKCTWEWATENNIKGYKVTGANGNSIFLPCAGFWVGKPEDIEDGGKGRCGYYWSSTLYPLDSMLSYILCMLPGMEDDQGEFVVDRSWGCSIRPVSD